MGISDLKAKDIMIPQQKLITIFSEDKVVAADLKMVRSGIGGLPVVEKDGTLVGIITQRDILLSRFHQIGELEVADLMTRNPITVTEETSIKEILLTMSDQKIERLPVVKGNKIVGLIVHDKILRALAQGL
ncbi:MAG: CBS domain-containing protein [Euryarchaeota archaeon]|nr:CBS domain-containing protein [Euryarchaeota archaeon]